MYLIRKHSDCKENFLKPKPQGLLFEYNEKNGCFRKEKKNPTKYKHLPRKAMVK